MVNKCWVNTELTDDSVYLEYKHQLKNEVVAVNAGWE